ncbi:KpsF/GutQ family sugar-phosphate isomerase [Microvirga arsenatis]|uniref:KpsF/GutQ family sugar-phosphate isomerase n=1 Tax=Microvirga arsenatis TaxID=2692265 RepID=A0ABW9YZL8_9HYPH|nr:KpsF/GutQ family sugar-phosphate isomerase [Microvirga arsenatis]NBJ12192.1 KpsF/GutQ family sugar-phosphate isomerase [Microvirga arsenatis]NBJ25844.1 KpsF/GutQ family sugar-phosphate isomerase [Microvirga arsenatis]
MALAKPLSPSPDQAVASALRTLAAERDGLTILMEAIGNGLGGPFTAAVETIAAAKGRVIVTGMGKSGHVGRKITATFASTGTPAHYVHPAEASHGDLGMIQTDDVIIALSWSGETAELADIIGYSRRFRVPLVAMTSNADSTLGRAADICLTLPKAKEACPNGLAPTTSTTIQLALGDALAVALLERRGFTAENFRVFHPGGKLGARLKLVRDIMHVGERLPLVGVEARMGEAIEEIGRKGFGAVIVVNGDGTLAGIVTDGDLRRNLRPDLATLPVAAVMTRTPRTIAPDALVATALEMEEASRITALIVVEGGKPVGLVHYLDLLRAGAA